MGGRGVEVGGGGVLDDLAGVHHGDSVAHPGDDAEVVGDQQHGDVEALLKVGEQVEDLRLDRHVEGGRRLVGDEQLRLACQGHGDEDALAHPAGHLERVLLDALGRVGDADHVEQLDGPGPGRPCGSSLRWRRITSTIWLPTVNTGSSDVIGSWKTIAISRPRTRSIVDAALPWTSDSPFQRTSPPTMRPGSSIIPSKAWAVTLLPEPDSPTRPSVSPLPIVKLTSRTACTVPAPGHEVDLEVVDLEDGRRAHPAHWCTMAMRLNVGGDGRCTIELEAP